MSTALGVAAGASIVAAAAISSAAAGIYKLATFSQQLGSEIHDLSQKINFSAETLSSLKIAAELSGGSLASLSTSLGIFDRNMEEAKDRTSEMAGVFKVLKIETEDNEVALRRAFTVLGDLEGGAQQTAIAMKLFGRSGKEVLGIIKETGGNIDNFIDRMREMGLVITKDGAQKADKFGDELTLLQLKLESVARQIGQELVPTVSKAADDISRWLKANQGEIVKTAKELGSLISQVYAFGKAVASPFVMQVIITRKIVDIASNLSASGVGASQTNIFGAVPGFGTPRAKPGPQLRGDEGEFVLTGSTVPQSAGSITFPKTGRGGGGGGGGGSARSDPAVQLLKALEDQFRSLTPQTELQKVQQRLLNEEYAKSTDAMKRKIMITAIEIDQQTKILALTREHIAISRLRRVTDPGLESSVRDRIFDPVTWGAGQRLRRVGEPDTTMDATRSRIATVEAQVMRERMAMIHEQMAGLGQDLTSVFARSIGDGFEQGAKRGLASLAQGLLDIVQNIFLKRLAEGLGNIFSGAATGGGGGFWSGLFNAIVGAAVGGAAGGLVNLGGGSTFTPGGTGAIRPRIVGSRASGGPISAGMAYQVHKDEVIMPMRDSMVFNKSQQAQVVNNYTINLPPSPKGGYTSPKSQRELGDKLLAMLQGSQA